MGQIGVTTALVFGTWRRTVGDRTEAGGAGNVERTGTPRGPAQGVRSVTSAPLERRSPGLITCQVECVVRLSVRQPQKGILGEAAIKDQAGSLGGRRSSAYGAY